MPATEQQKQSISATPALSANGLAPTGAVTVSDEFGERRELNIAGENPLTIKVDGREVVTLMTLGTHPELLALGYLRNQRLLESLTDIKSVQVDWERDLASVSTHLGEGIIDWENKLQGRTITTGCGQGTVFSCTLDKLYDQRLTPRPIRQSTIYALLRNVLAHNHIYKRAGAVHGCGLCRNDQILTFVEDVGRHNAADTISGMMWLDDEDGADKLFYTTGRLTSEMVMKAALMGIPILVSRNGCTRMGLDLARDLGITLIARATGTHFLVYHGHEWVEFDAVPKRRKILRTPGRTNRVHAI